MNVLFVPSIGLDPTLIARLADSVDFPIKHKVAFNNGPAGALDDFAERHRDWIVKDNGYNRGVAGSWNECSVWFKEEPCWLIMNEDAWFLPGQLEQICKCADANLEAPMIHFNSSNAYYGFVWTAKGKERCGTFDENFWPAYHEDCDMRIRHRLLGIHTYTYALEGQPVVPHGKPQCGGMNYAALIQGAGLINRTYWYRKWGSFDYENALFPNPNRDRRIPPSEWIWYPEHREKIRPLWDSFMSLPSPSIYG